MKEIGGYLELDMNTGSMLHQDGILLNCGRNALAYLLKARDIKRIWLPYFLCDSVFNVCKKYGVEIVYYHINNKWLPVEIELASEDWLYIVNYYGQLDKEDIVGLVSKYKRVIVDNAQAYFEEPLPKVDTLYTCRKFFGVSDGAVLFTDCKIKEDLSMDESFERIHFVLGRFERCAGGFYQEASSNNEIFDNEPIKSMSKLTRNILHGVEYQFVNTRRTENFRFLNERLKSINTLKVKDINGAFMYPLMIEDAQRVKKRLLEHEIYIPILWPNVVNDLPHDWWEWKLANNILPLPCDQRYGLEEMKYIVNMIIERMSRL